MQGWFYLVVIATAIWIAIDASHLGARRGTLGGGMLDMGPVGWFFATLLLWIVALPCYLVTRPKLVRRDSGFALYPQFAPGSQASAGVPMPAGGSGYWPGSAPTGTAPGYPSPPAQHAPAPIAGWYPSPDGNGMTWWDGVKWTADRI